MNLQQLRDEIKSLLQLREDIKKVREIINSFHNWNPAEQCPVALICDIFIAVPTSIAFNLMDDHLIGLRLKEGAIEKKLNLEHEDLPLSDE